VQAPTRRRTQHSGYKSYALLHTASLTRRLALWWPWPSSAYHASPRPLRFPAAPHLLPPGTRPQTKKTDNYFLQSASGIGYFFEDKAFDESGALKQAKELSLNKVRAWRPVRGHTCAAADL
jgi:hypothetical protein